jgi:hypothetical protein
VIVEASVGSRLLAPTARSSSRSSATRAHIGVLLGELTESPASTTTSTAF